jgi:hypothetical protein
MTTPTESDIKKAASDFANADFATWTADVSKSRCFCASFGCFVFG